MDGNEEEMVEERAINYKPLVLLLLLIFFFWIFADRVVGWCLLQSGAQASVAEIYGAVNALFTGLAFAGFLFTVYLQRRELEIQRQELRLQRKELKMTREELARTATAQESSETALRKQATVMAGQAVLSAKTARISAAATIIDNLVRQREDDRLTGTAASRIASMIGDFLDEIEVQHNIIKEMDVDD